MSQYIINNHAIDGVCPVCGGYFAKLSIIIDLSGREIEMTWWFFHEGEIVLDRSRRARNRERACTATHIDDISVDSVGSVG